MVCEISGYFRWKIGFEQRKMIIRASEHSVEAVLNEVVKRPRHDEL